MNVIKANGEIVPFDAEKIRQSLRRAGAKSGVIDEVIETVTRKIYDRIPTAELYRTVFNELRNRQKDVAGRYDLKRAIMELGPTGFPFEKFVAALWQTEGFTTTTGQIIQGHCVSHEVDVTAEKDDLHYQAECKFHSFQGKVCDVKHALYVHARFQDIEKKLAAADSHSNKTHKGWLVTNTRMTSDAITFGTCAGLGLLSWDFPAEKSLRSWIDGSGLHPVTCLTSLSVKEKRQVLEKGVVLCRDLVAHPQILIEIGIPSSKIDEVIEESYVICEGPNEPV